MQIRYVNTDGQAKSQDLYGVFAALARDEIVSFTALRPHQRQAWHCFVVQVATLALRNDDRETLPLDSDAWRTLLTRLTPDFPDGEPWSLVVDDWSKPALLQPPGMPKPSSKSTRLESCPDGIDMLVTGRNHDIKGERMDAANDDDWLFALVTLQTLEGQMGAGNPGISRMNGGYGARVSLGVRREPDRWGRAVRRDIETLLEKYDAFSRLNPMRGDIALTWLSKNEGIASIGSKSLHPLYIDCCRRIRLGVEKTGRIRALVVGSKVARVDAKEMKGVTGDPWAPIMADASKSWGIAGSGFGYRQMTTLLSSNDISLPILAMVHSADAESEVSLHAVAITRGQGKTEGFHERSILIPKFAVPRFGRSQGRKEAGKEARARMETAGDAQRILKHALFVLLQNGPENARLDDDAAKAKMQHVLTNFDSVVDSVFFGADFWEALSDEPRREGETDRYRSWRVQLAAIARRIFGEAVEEAPRTQMRFYRAVAKSTSLIEGRLHRFIDPIDPDSEASKPASTNAV